MLRFNPTNINWDLSGDLNEIKINDSFGIDTCSKHSIN